MLDATTYTPRLKTAYRETIRPALMEELGYKNVMMIPRLEKIVLNMGVGEAVKDTKKVKQAQEELSRIAGQKAVITKARASLPLVALVGALALLFLEIFVQVDAQVPFVYFQF